MGISTQRILQLFLVGFSGVFLFFMALYWPMLMANRTPTVRENGGILDEVRAGEGSGGCPIETSEYKISYEARSDSYYVFVKGVTVSQFVENKNAAQLALKNKLMEESLCDKQIIYAPSMGIEVPAEFKTTSGCN